MKRKIEKYLATKQGVDDKHVRLTVDGRFDFADDLEGVLEAVRRGADSARKAGPSTGKKVRKASAARKKSAAPPSSAPALASFSSSAAAAAPMMMAMPLMYGGMNQYGVPGKENDYPQAAQMAMVPFGTAGMVGNRQPGHISFSPRSIAKSMTPLTSTSQTPFQQPDTGLASYFSSTGKKSVFNSPGPLSGMTPFMNPRDTFGSTPFNRETFFSPENVPYSDELNKTLFGQSTGKPPKAQSPVSVRFRIGGDVPSDVSKDADLRHVSVSPIKIDLPQQAGGAKATQTTGASSRATAAPKVSLSPTDVRPLCTPGVASQSKQEQADKDRMPPPSVTFAEMMADDNKTHSSLGSNMPSIYSSNGQYAVNVSQDDDSVRSISAPSPWDSSAMGLPTPSRIVGDSSFWPQQFGFSPANASMTPFKSPAGVPRNGKGVGKSTALLCVVGSAD
jgi:hypothetical protein